MVGAEAKALGRGGVSTAARAAGLSRPTVHKAVAELASSSEATLAPGRSRRPGGGRKRAVDRDPEFVAAIESLVDPDSRGDPESPLRWTTKSTRRLAGALADLGHHVSHVRVAEVLHSLKYSLQGNATIQVLWSPVHDIEARRIDLDALDALRDLSQEQRGSHTSTRHLHR